MNHEIESAGDVSDRERAGDASDRVRASRSAQASCVDERTELRLRLLGLGSLVNNELC